MKRPYIFILSILLIFSLSACSDKNELKELNEKLFTIASEKSNAEKQLEIVLGEKNNIIGISISAVILALIVGSMMGSKARKDVKKEPKKEDEKSE